MAPTTVATALLLAFSAALAARPACGAQQLREQALLGHKPLLRVAELETAPRIDGRLDDPAWTAAQPARPFWHFQTGVRASHDTCARIGLDSENLYVAFRCAEPEMGKLSLGALPPDSMSVYARDHVEFFIVPDALKPGYYQFSVDASGNRHDSAGTDGSWQGQWAAAASRGTDAWTVEMRIPRTTIGLVAPQMSLANFCRTRRIAPAETTAWSKTSGIFHNPGRFGRLVYGPPSSVRFAAISLRQPRIGENLVHAVVAGARGPTDLVVKGHLRAGERTSCFGVRKLRLTQGAEGSVSLPLRVPRDTKAGLTVVLEQDGRVLTFCDAAEVALTGASPAPIRKVLAPDAAPFMRWIDTRRLRGISYGFGFTRAMPDGGLTKAATPAASASRDRLHLRGESYFKILVEENDGIHFDLAAAAGDSPFTSSIYAVFGPKGKMLGKGIVEAGTSREIRVPTEAPGTHTLLINSGPASWNPFSVTVHNRHWALDARGKNTYVGTPVSMHSLRDSKLAGFNIGLVAAWLWGIPFKDEKGLAKWSDKLERLCQGSQDAGLRLIPYVGWGCSRTECEAAGDYVRALTRLPLRGPQPCPISREYWERSFLRRAMAIARLSKKYPCVVGVGLDPESYYFGSWYGERLKSPQEKRRAGSVYMPYSGSREKCICNRCFNGFLKSKGIAPPILPEDGNARFDWIARQKLLDALCAYQQAELEKILKSVAQRVHAVNPELCFAVMVMSASDTWFCRGVSRGLGTGRVPVLDFDEGTYTPGYSTRAVGARLARYKKWGADVVHGGCLWALKHPPHDPHFLSAQMFNFALYGHGYWFWPGSMSVWRSADKVRGYYSLSGYAEDYWKSIAVANREIDKRLASPDAYRSPLERIRPRPAIPQQPEKQNEWARKPCYPVHVYPGTRLSFVVPPGRKSVRVVWGYRETVGKRTLLVNVAGTERRLTAHVMAEQANAAKMDVPDGGCTGWLELQRAAGQAEKCVGITIEGAKPFFAGAHGMSLR